MYMFLFWQILISWTNSFPKFSWVRDFTTKNQEFATKLGFSLYTILLITKMRQIEARCFKWCKGCKINPIRILEMGTF